jgi:DmsE family decaheme c-type cytochrome
MHYVHKFQGKSLLGLIIALSIPILIFSFSSLVGGQDNPQTNQQQPAESGYVGSETCAACHADMVEHIGKTPHGGPEYAKLSGEKGCEHCHGPGQAHVDAGGDKTLIRSFKSMKPGEATSACLECHEKGTRMHWKGSVHEQRQVGCVSCHSVHNFKSEHAQLKNINQTEQCGTCHQGIKAQTMKTSHHPIREGLMSCSDCHDPHGTMQAKMIVQNSVNEQCFTCHAEKRGPFLWEHPPVKENCLNCHNPHGSNHPKLMVAKRPYLCQTCHLDTRHPGTLYDGTANSLASNREFLRSCSNCHLTVHGSNHPSGWTFLK